MLEIVETLLQHIYYDYFHKKPSKRELENNALKDEILNIYNESKQRYGAPKIHVVLSQKGYSVSIKRVQRKMRELGIRFIVTKKFRPTRSSQKVEEKPNLINQDFSTTKANEKWVGDITYIH